MTAVLHIYLSGSFRLDPPYTLPGRNAQRLLVYLLLWPHTTHQRDTLAEQLWPHMPPERGRRALSDALYRLRQTIGLQQIQADSKTITLAPAADLWVDVWAFEACLNRQQWVEAAAIYTGDLAPEIDDDWIWGRREQLQQQITAVLLKLGETAENQQQFEIAICYYHRLIEMDNMNEVAQRGLMRCLAGQNRLEEALTLYQNFQQFLAQELSVAPAPPTQQLAHQLQAEWELQQQRDSHPAKLPFVGRVMERGRLLARLDQARNGQGGMVVILGEAGIGKSRLLESLVQSADWRGWQIGQGGGEEFRLPSPYAPLAETLTAVLPRPRLQQLAQLLPSWVLTLIKHIVPTIGHELPLHPLPDSTRPDQQLPVALHLLLNGLQQIAPHLLILDDVQWADPAIWLLLDYLQPALVEMSVLLVISGRLTALREQTTTWELLQKWEQAGVMILRLGGLEPQALAELARGIRRDSLSVAELADLYQTSGGNPLLALSLLETDISTAQPELLALQRRRLAHLSDAALLVLQAAAVLGYHFDYRLWENMVMGISSRELPGLVGELENGRFLILERTGYRFHHDTLRACVYQDTPAERRQQLHRRAFEVYSQHAPQETVSLLYHATEAGEQTAVIHYALLAGQQALERFVYQSARQYFSQAIAMLSGKDLTNRYTALLGRVRATAALGDRMAQGADLVLLRSLAEQIGNNQQTADVLALQAKFFWQTADFLQARQIAQEGLQLTQNPITQAVLWEVLGQVERDQGNYQIASQHFEQAGNLFRQMGNEEGTASSYLMLGIVAQRMGDFEQAIALLRQAEEMAKAVGNRSLETAVLGNMVVTYWGQGNYTGAIACCHQSLALSREVGALWIESATLSNLGSLHGILGDYSAAIEYAQQALTVARMTRNRQELASISSNLAYFYLDSGQAKRALPLFDEALALNRQLGRKRGEGYTLQGRGSALHTLGRYAEAVADLKMAQTLRQELGETSNLCLTEAELTLALLAHGQLEEAAKLITAVLERLAPQISPDTRQRVHFAAYQTFWMQQRETAALQQLQKAEQILQETAETLPAEQRARFLQTNPINQAVLTAVQSHTECVRVKLVKTDVALGRKLTENDFLLVSWTLYTVSDESVPSGVRRQHVLKRLLAEAAQQGATPTDDDLARALQVSRRTILRDMAVLTAETNPLTRRRNP